MCKIGRVTRFAVSLLRVVLANLFSSHSLGGEPQFKFCPSDDWAQQANSGDVLGDADQCRPNLVKLELKSRAFDMCQIGLINFQNLRVARTRCRSWSVSVSLCAGPMPPPPDRTESMHTFPVFIFRKNGVFCLLASRSPWRWRSVA